MSQLFTRLRRVLELEAQQGYQNEAVVGGIRQFAIYWVGQAREQVRDEADRALVEQVAEVLMDYARLSGVEARKQAIDALLTGLDRRESRQSTGASAAAAPQPTRPTATKPSTRTSPTPQVPPETEADSAKAEPQETVEPDPVGLAQSVREIKGVGPKIATLLHNLGASTILDLLYLFPRRYDDYTLMKPINKLQIGERVTVIGTIWQTTAKRMRNNKVMVQSVISDGTGSIQATWFNQPWLVDKLPAGMQIVLSGKVEQFLGRPVFNSPEWETLEMEPLRTRRIVPIYPLTEGLAASKMRDIMKRTVAYWALRVPDPLPPAIRDRLQLQNLPDALQQLHFPDSQEALHAARRRLTFDELFLLQLGLQNQRHQWRSKSAVTIAIAPGHLIQFRNTLPYSLTAAQKRVVEEIMADLEQDVPMNRLLQGDVGSGKTVVAAAAMYVTVMAGAQAALMAPTEILTEQHLSLMHI